MPVGQAMCQGASFGPNCLIDNPVDMRMASGCNTNTPMFDLKAANARLIMIVLLPVILPSCKSREGGAVFWENERELIELDQRRKLAEYRLGLSESGKAGELENLKTLLSESGDRLLHLHAEKSALNAEIERLASRNDELSRVALGRKRSRARGMEFEAFASRDGRIFKNATITEVDDSGVAFRHEHGAARLRYAELSDEQRLFFGLDKSAALAAEQQERREALAYERRIDAELAAMQASDERAAALEERESVSRTSSSMLMASSSQSQLRELAQPARPFGRGTSYRRYYNYSGYRSYRPVYHPVYSYTAAPNPFCPPSRPRVQQSGAPPAFPQGIRACTPFVP